MLGYSKNLIVTTILWHFSLYKKTLLLTSRNTVQAVVLSVTSRVFHLLSFLLPLKAIMLAGASSPPAFLTRSYPNITVSDLVLGLSLITIFFYWGNILLQRLIETRVNLGAIQIANRLQKVVASQNVTDETERLYNSVVKSFSCVVYYLTLSVVLILLYPKLFAVFSGAIFIPWLTVFLIFENTNSALYKWMSNNRLLLQRQWTFFVFYSVFAVIIFDIFNTNVELPILLAIASFIMSRYALSAVNESINIGFKLYSQRAKVNNLLFFTPPKNYSKLSEQKLTNSLLNIEQAEHLAQELIQKLGFGSKTVRKMTWRSINVFGVYGFDLYITDSKDRLVSEDEKYCLKIFQKKYKFLADHEKLLLNNHSSKTLPAPKIVGTGVIKNFECILLLWPGIAVQTLPEYESGIISVLKDTWAIDTSTKVLSAYARSHKSCIEKLEKFQVESLSLICFDEEDQKNLTELVNCLADIKKCVMLLPKALHNPELTINVMSMDSDKNPVIAQWGRWSIEPIGTALWYFDFIDDETLERIIEQLRNTHVNCCNLVPDHLRLSGELYKLWKLIGSQKLPEALVASTNVLKIYNRLNNLEAVHKAKLKNFG